MVSRVAVSEACQVCLDIASSAFAETELAGTSARKEPRSGGLGPLRRREGGAKLAHVWTKETVGSVQKVAKGAYGLRSSKPNDVPT